MPSRIVTKGVVTAEGIGLEAEERAKDAERRLTTPTCANCGNVLTSEQQATGWNEVALGFVPGGLRSGDAGKLYCTLACAEDAGEPWALGRTAGGY